MRQLLQVMRYKLSQHDDVLYLMYYIWLGKGFLSKAMLIVLQHVNMVIMYVGVFLIKHLYLNGVCEECTPHKRCLKEIGLQFQIVLTTLHVIVNKIWGGGGGGGESMLFIQGVNTHACI